MFEYKEIKQGLWLYLLLLIFEGALRKWVLPQFSDILLIIRDPLALFLLVKASTLKIYYSNSFLIQIWVIAIISLGFTLTLGHQNLNVAIYGIRVFLLHLPLAFLMGHVFDKNDVIKVGKFFLYLSIPMTILLIAQFFSPQTAWVNRGVGGDLSGAGFDGALGYMRPPGTFSFTNGTSSFYGLLAAFLMYFLFISESIPLLILVLSGVSLIIAIPISISRTLLFLVSAIILIVLPGLYKFKEKVNKIFGIGITLFIVYLALNLFSFFDTVLNVFNTRFERANESEGGLESVFFDRYLGGLASALTEAPNKKVSGVGLGYGTNVGSVLLTNNKSFLISEGEWGRMIGEMGPILGIWMILVKLFISLKSTLHSYRLLSENNFLSWTLLPYMLLNFPQGSWNQPTAMGFSIVSLGLLIASFKSNLN
jgi:hypothetical protein